ncbi:MAG: IS200/IS605 family transposase [Bacteroidales bacterium]|nr:IS200/IS605 family transposase [Bacteroidales bacterium]MCF8458203.1 IS200/IS605 family transposase [Bacteroidales bacterium]
MSTFTQFLYQIVFTTKNREMTLLESGQERLYKFIWGILKNKKCHLYRIGGIENHLHIITHVHPTIAVADLIKDIKLSSSDFIKTEMLFPDFNGWQNGYSAFTYHISSKDNLIKYVKNQKQHHQKFDFKEELISLLIEHGIEYNEKYLL